MKCIIFINDNPVNKLFKIQNKAELIIVLLESQLEDCSLASLQGLAAVVVARENTFLFLPIFFFSFVQIFLQYFPSFYSLLFLPLSFCILYCICLNFLFMVIYILINNIINGHITTFHYLKLEFLTISGISNSL